MAAIVGLDVPGDVLAGDHDVAMPGEPVVVAAIAGLQLLLGEELREAMLLQVGNPLHPPILKAWRRPHQQQVELRLARRQQ